jgi:cellulose synthase/poly-beta-1,6-N-acetylglucosamine synthase-like glycosyltransferase
MYNEEKVIVQTIQNLLAVEYNKFSIIVVDDGSTDDSYALVDTLYSGHPKVKLLRQINAGKSAALNKGVKASSSDIIVTIDADTWVRSDAIGKIVAYFDDKDVAAVAGHIKVGNRVNLLTEMQYFEYIAIWDNDRAMFDAVNGILVIPGALSAFRRAAVEAVGGFKSEMIAEDTELTLRLLRHNYVLRNARDAVAFTEAPDNLKMFFRQRIRWTVGLMQGLLQHNRTLFSHVNRYLPYLVLPMTWGFRVIFPFFLALVDYYFIYSFFVKHYMALVWWPAIIFTEAVTNYVILKRNKEKVSILKLIIIQRLYRHLLFCNYWVILLNWLNGNLFRWRKITRKGNITINDNVPGSV